MKLALLEASAYIEKGDYGAADPQTRKSVVKYLQEHNMISTERIDYG